MYACANMCVYGSEYVRVSVCWMETVVWYGKLPQGLPTHKHVLQKQNVAKKENNVGEQLVVLESHFIHRLIFRLRL